MAKSILGEILKGPYPLNIEKRQEIIDDTSAITQGIGDLVTNKPNYRSHYGTTNRNEQVMTWRLPGGGAVQMYINPQNFQIKESKQIEEVRTKGGFVVQYWGENLIQLTLSGTTGSSGVRGINVLRDIYRSENKGFDVVAAQLMNEIEETTSSPLEGRSLSKQMETLARDVYNRNFLLRPTLGSLAVSMILFYQGVQYKGFFKDFSVTEGIEKLGLFDYVINFTATEVRGQRKNFLGWHKEPLADDFAGQLINGVGNAARSAFGLAEQPPEAFHPSNAPLSFGGNSLASGLGLSSDPLTQNQTIFL